MAAGSHPAFTMTARQHELDAALRALERILSRAAIASDDRGVLEAALAVLERQSRG